jgi:hypothetical protein
MELCTRSTWANPAQTGWESSQLATDLYFTQNHLFWPGKRDIGASPDYLIGGLFGSSTVSKFTAGTDFCTAESGDFEYTTADVCRCGLSLPATDNPALATRRDRHIELVRRATSLY